MASMLVTKWFLLLLTFGCSYILYFMVIKDYLNRSLTFSKRVLDLAHPPSDNQSSPTEIILDTRRVTAMLQSDPEIITFLRTCQQHSIRPFLIEPSLLELLTSTSTATAEATSTDSVISFGLIYDANTSFRQTMLQLISHGFNVDSSSLHCSELDNPFALNALPCLGNKTLTPDLHFFVQLSDKVLHIVVFYRRTAHMLWHGPVDSVLFQKYSVTYGVTAGAYDALELRSVHIGGRDDVLFFLPSDPALFLHQQSLSSFLECNHSVVHHFETTYPKWRTSQRMVRLYEKPLIHLKQRVESRKLPIWIWSGTLLGWLRQCTLIPFTSDVDLATWAPSYSAGLRTNLMTDSFFVHKYVFGLPELGLEFQFYTGTSPKQLTTHIDIFFVYAEKDHVWNGLMEGVHRYKLLFPKFSKLCSCELIGHRFTLPCEPEQHVRAQYGADWPTPKQRWLWNQSPPNLVKNGVWKPEEMKAACARVDRMGRQWPCKNN